MNINLFVSALVLTPHFAQSHMSTHLALRQVLDCGSNPVDCGEGWCCLIGNICQSAPNNGFVCIDQLLTQSDGYGKPSPRRHNYYHLYEQEVAN